MKSYAGQPISHTFAICMIGVFCAPAVAASVSLNPGDDIQAALDAASPGDEVILLAGTHPMPTGLVMRNGVALVGADRDTTILDGGLTIADAPAQNFIFFSAAMNDARTRVSNLTITGTHGVLGGAFVVTGASAGEISRNRIRNNYAIDGGSAIWVDGNTSPDFLIAFNLIHHNEDSDGTDTHAVQLDDTAAPTIQNNTVAYNDDNGIFVAPANPWPLLINNILFRNGRDFPPAVVLDTITLEPISGVAGNVGRGTCYFAAPPPPGVRLSHNLFGGNLSASVLVVGSLGGEFENPLDLEALQSFIVGSRYYPRGVSDEILFADGPNGDFRIRQGSAADGTGDPNIASQQGVSHIGAEQVTVPPIPGDQDADGTADGSDNCPTDNNPGQHDQDNDGVGDVCDNCPFTPNLDQSDDDGDGVGNACDQCPGFDDALDADGDQIPDGCDTCHDTDGDGFGDPGFPLNQCPEDGCPADPLKSEPGVCGCGIPDDDSDGDGTLDCNDECPLDPAVVTISEESPAASTCADGIDNDCDGLADGNDPGCAGLSCICADFDVNGVVNLLDFATFALCFGATTASAPECSCTDLNFTGTVNLLDFATFAFLFGNPTTLSPPNCI